MDIVPDILLGERLADFLTAGTFYFLFDVVKKIVLGTCPIWSVCLHVIPDTARFYWHHRTSLEPCTAQEFGRKVQCMGLCHVGFCRGARGEQGRGLNVNEKIIKLRPPYIISPNLLLNFIPNVQRRINILN